MSWFPCDNGLRHERVKRCKNNVDLSTIFLSTKRRRCSDVLITTSFYQQYHDVAWTSFNQPRFYNAVTTSWHGGTTLRRKNNNNATLPARRVSTGWFKLCWFFLSKFCNCKFIHAFSLQLKISYHTKGVFRTQTNISDGTIPLEKKQRPTS